MAKKWNDVEETCKVRMMWKKRITLHEGLDFELLQYYAYY